MIASPIKNYCMKTTLILLIFFIFLGNSTLKAQSKSEAPKWMCEKGYWVIQSNVKTPKNCVIYFYTTQHQLVYKEVVSGKRINIEKTNIRKHLEAVLNQAIAAWQKEGIVKENQQLVITRR
jgi:hypothetical protein